MTDTILFEQPINERCRTLLRLEHLFGQFQFHLAQTSLWHSRATMNALLDVGAVLARADIKSDLLKELERYFQSLSAMANRPGVDAERLQQILDEIRQTSLQINSIDGQLGQGIRKDEFLKSIQNRNALPGGDSNFDLPEYQLWLSQDDEQRRITFNAWAAELKPIQDSVALLLSLIRTSAVPQNEMAEQGFFNRQLPSQASVQLIRIGLPRSLALYPEISAGKHRFSLRFLATEDWQHPVQTTQDVAFDLTVCII